MIFVGECSLSFSRAAAQLFTKSGKIEKWFLTEILWPEKDLKKKELDANILYFEENFGDEIEVYYPVSIDVTDLDSLQSIPHGTFDGMIWSMPYVDSDFGPGESSVAVAIEMQKRIRGFVETAAKTEFFHEESCISVVIAAKQHLSWGLRKPICTAVGNFVPTVHLVSLEDLTKCGYKPSFGDERDKNRVAKYHKNSDAVVVCWRIKSRDDLGGISDAKLRSRKRPRNAVIKRTLKKAPLQSSLSIARRKVEPESAPAVTISKSLVAKMRSRNCPRTPVIKKTKKSPLESCVSFMKALVGLPGSS